jgi:hypothetical protein
MKKKFLIMLVVLLFTICASTFSDIHDYWEDGWVASTGQDIFIGTAINVKTIPGGYSFKCLGNGICYEINGPWLDIYEGIGSSGLEVEIFRQ